MDNQIKTRDFFNQWSNYHCLVNELDTYRFASAALDGEIKGVLLDVGNGGVFNYDVSLAERLVSVDIAEDLSHQTNTPPNVSFKVGDATNLPCTDQTFDTCLVQFLIHHLAEQSYAATQQRTRRCLQEAFRVLKPGGRLVIIESCLPKPWERAERFLFPCFRLVLKWLGHPIVFQWNWRTLEADARVAGFTNVELSSINLGKWVIQLGHRWPTALTPIRLYKIVAHKPVAGIL